MSELDAVLEPLVADNLDQIFDASQGDVRLRALSLSEPLHPNANRHHRRLTVHGEVGGEARDSEVWLKFVMPNPDRYEMHRAVYERTHTVCSLFPRPYFYGEYRDDGIIAMEIVEGTVLRDLFLRRTAMRRDRSIRPVFEAIGQGLRAFHDVSERSGEETVAELRQRVRSVVAFTPYLAHDERRGLIARVDAAAEAAGMDAALPQIRVHHDCTLRNVVVQADGSPRLLDVDAMIAVPKSRYYDLSILLTNLESLVKFSPVTTAGQIRAAWESFWAGYVGTEGPDGMSPQQVEALLYLIKVDYAYAGTWLPLFEVYTDRLARRYLSRLKRSLLAGRPLAL